MSERIERLRAHLQDMDGQTLIQCVRKDAEARKVNLWNQTRFQIDDYYAGKDLRQLLRTAENKLASGLDHLQTARQQNDNTRAANAKKLVDHQAEIERL